MAKKKDTHSAWLTQYTLSRNWASFLLFFFISSLFTISFACFRVKNECCILPSIDLILEAQNEAACFKASFMPIIVAQYVYDVNSHERSRVFKNWKKRGKNVGAKTLQVSLCCCVCSFIFALKLNVIITGVK